MSVQLLQKCCCGEGPVPVCPEYGPHSCDGLSEFSLVTTPETTASLIYQYDLFMELKNEGTFCKFKDTGTAAKLINIVECSPNIRSAPQGTSFAKSPGLAVPSENPGANCDFLQSMWTRVEVSRIVLNEDGEIETFNPNTDNIVFASAFSLFSIRNEISVQFPDTLAERTDVNGDGSVTYTRLEVVWNLQGCNFAGSIKYTANQTGSDSFNYQKTMQVQYAAGPLAAPVESDSYECCPVSAPVFDEIEPPDDFFDPDPDPDPECPLGCQPGPIGFSTLVAGLGGGVLPTQEEWEAANGTWGCAKGVTVQCSPELVIFAVVPCGASVSPDALQGLCDIFDIPGGLSMPALFDGSGNTGTGCGNCGNGGVL